MLSELTLVLRIMVPELIRRVQECDNIERAIVATQLWSLSAYEDSHIFRKHEDILEVMEAQQAARRVLDLGGLDTPQGRQAYCELDAWLCADNHARNPGTTADLLAACLFVALRQEAIALTTPFVWEDIRLARIRPREREPPCPWWERGWGEGYFRERESPSPLVGEGLG